MTAQLLWIITMWQHWGADILIPGAVLTHLFQLSPNTHVYAHTHLSLRVRMSGLQHS